MPRIIKRKKKIRKVDQNHSVSSHECENFTGFIGNSDSDEI